MSKSRRKTERFDPSDDELRASFASVLASTKRRRARNIKTVRNGLSELLTATDDVISIIERELKELG